MFLQYLLQFLKTLRTYTSLHDIRHVYVNNIYNNKILHINLVYVYTTIARRSIIKYLYILSSVSQELLSI